MTTNIFFAFKNTAVHLEGWQNTQNIIQKATIILAIL